jgi:photosystem II stability/assembly factor-like uncharacterized protein
MYRRIIGLGKETDYMAVRLRGFDCPVRSTGFDALIRSKGFDAFGSGIKPYPPWMALGNSNKLFGSTDLGLTWTPYSNLVYNPSEYTAHFAAGNNGILTVNLASETDCYQKYSSNGGNTWHNVSPSISYQFSTLRYAGHDEANKDVFVLTGGGVPVPTSTISRSTDNGQSYNYVPSSYNIGNVFSFGNGTLLSTTTSGATTIIIKSVDYGTTWYETNLPTTVYDPIANPPTYPPDTYNVYHTVAIYNIAGSPAGVCLADCSLYDINSMGDTMNYWSMLRSYDYGDTWEVIPSSENNYIYQQTFYTDENIWMKPVGAGGATLASSDDSGDTWDSWNITDYNLIFGTYMSGSKGICFADGVGHLPAYSLRSADYGHTWNVVTINGSSGDALLRSSYTILSGTRGIEGSYISS